MNTFEFSRKLAAINENTIRQIGIESVHENSDAVILDSILTNHPNYLTMREMRSNGKTFAGTPIHPVDNINFSDWDHTFEFHDKLKFAGKDDIDFNSEGAGYDSIMEHFEEEEWIAPTAASISKPTKSDLRKSFIKKLKAL